ncbi:MULTISPECIES: hypothetical protein [unclassified Clavibacter]|nr:hypothetical protein [Clavibacter sp. CT19]MDA3805115.1 hypothetical protein [Clavibacter sp. CT19]
MLATAALAAVIALGVSVATPAGPATATPVVASSSASSSPVADPIAASEWLHISSRTYFVSSTDLSMLASQQISLAGLAVKTCTAHGSGRTCVPLVEAGLRLLGRVTVFTCGGLSGYTVVVPSFGKSHCGR